MSFHVLFLVVDVERVIFKRSSVIAEINVMHHLFDTYISDVLLIR